MSAPKMYCEISKNGKVVQRSRNLRGMITRVGRELVNRVAIYRSADGGAIMAVEFGDGSYTRLSFASWDVARQFVRRRATRWDVVPSSTWETVEWWHGHPGSARMQPQSHRARA